MTLTLVVCIMLMMDFPLVSCFESFVFDPSLLLKSPIKKSGSETSFFSLIS